MKRMTCSLSLVALFAAGSSVASDRDDFDGQVNSNGIKYIETYTPTGVVPPPNVAARQQGTADAMPTHVMTPAPDPDAESAMTPEQAAAWRSSVRSGFKNAYQRAGKPGIAVFWNREFNDELSQWYSDKRVVRTGEQAHNTNDKFEPASGSKLDGYNRSMTGGSRIVEAQYFAECNEALKVSASRERGETDKDAVSAEVTPNAELCYQVLNKRAPTGDDMGGKAKEFEFSSGYMQPFFGSGAKMLDRAAIMRITQRDNANKAGAEMISDSQQIETDALIGYADYLAEVVYSSKSGTQLGVEFLVTVKEVSSGRVVAMFRSEGTPADLDKPKEEWVATATGFSKRTTSAETEPKAVGEQLAYETMEALSRVW